MSVEIRVINNQRGKGLFARQDIPAGGTIFEEDPLICCQFSWNESYGYQSCNHCLRPLETAEENARRLTNKTDLVLPFPECCKTRKELIVSCLACHVCYCSESCRVEAFEKYHRGMCGSRGLEELVEAWKRIHYPPETSSIMLLVRILFTIQQSVDRSQTIARFMQFCHRTINEEDDLAHKLIGAPFASQIELLLDILRNAIPSDGLEHFLTLEGFKSLLALIATNGQGVATSSISAWVNNACNLPLEEPEKSQLDKIINQLYLDLDKESGDFLDNEGSALYALQSACNHSCAPNAKIHFRNNNYRLTMVAITDIPADTEVLISYLDDCALERSRHTRQKYLMDNYLFKCSCEKCLSQADDPEVTSEEEMSDSD